MRPAKLKSLKPASTRNRDLAAARRVLTHATNAITAISDSLNVEFSRAIDAIMEVKGRVVVSGMGKSGHIAGKIAATLSSTGTPALFLHPAEASHGDLGMVTRADALLMFSNSGETAELTDIITYAKRLRIPMIGVASRLGSSLLQASDVALQLPAAQEACPMGLAPTTSTTMMLALGDALAVALMERRGFSAEQYRDFHPGGALGKKLVRVGDIMHRELPIALPDAPMREVLITMTSGKFGGLAGYACVVDRKGALVGIITDGDLRRHMEPKLLDRQARDIMTPNPKTVPPEMLASEALTVMNASKPRVTHLIVVERKPDGSHPVGFISVHDVIRAGIT